MGKQFTTEQLLKIVGEGSYDLGYHDGMCHVLEKLVSDVREGSFYSKEEAIEDWAKEKFNIDIKSK